MTSFAMYCADKCAKLLGLLVGGFCWPFTKLGDLADELLTMAGNAQYTPLPFAGFFFIAASLFSSPKDYASNLGCYWTNILEMAVFGGFHPDVHLHPLAKFLSLVYAALALPAALILTAIGIAKFSQWIVQGIVGYFFSSAPSPASLSFLNFTQSLLITNISKVGGAIGYVLGAIPSICMGNNFGGAIKINEENKDHTVIDILSDTQPVLLSDGLCVLHTTATNTSEQISKITLPRHSFKK